MLSRFFFFQFLFLFSFSPAGPIPPATAQEGPSSTGRTRPGAAREGEPRLPVRRRDKPRDSFNAACALSRRNAFGAWNVELGSVKRSSRPGMTFSVRCIRTGFGLSTKMQTFPYLGTERFVQGIVGCTLVPFVDYRRSALTRWFSSSCSSRSTPWFSLDVGSSSFSGVLKMLGESVCRDRFCKTTSQLSKNDIRYATSIYSACTRRTSVCSCYMYIPGD